MKYTCNILWMIRHATYLLDNYKHLSNKKVRGYFNQGLVIRRNKRFKKPNYYWACWNFISKYNRLALHKGAVGDVAGKLRLKYFEVHRKTLCEAHRHGTHSRKYSKKFQGSRSNWNPWLLSFLGLVGRTCALYVNPSLYLNTFSFYGLLLLLWFNSIKALLLLSSRIFTNPAYQWHTC